MTTLVPHDLTLNDYECLECGAKWSDKPGSATCPKDKDHVQIRWTNFSEELIEARRAHRQVQEPTP